MLARPHLTAPVLLEATVKTLLAGPPAPQGITLDPPPLVPAQRAPQQTSAPSRVDLTPALVEQPGLLRARLDELLASGIRSLEADVSAVPVLSTAVLRALVDVDATLRCRGGRLHVLNPTARTLRVMAASRTLHLAAAADSVERRGAAPRGAA